MTAARSARQSATTAVAPRAPESAARRTRKRSRRMARFFAANGTATSAEQGDETARAEGHHARHGDVRGVGEIEPPSGREKDRDRQDGLGDEERAEGGGVERRAPEEDGRQPLDDPRTPLSLRAQDLEGEREGPRPLVVEQAGEACDDDRRREPERARKRHRRVGEPASRLQELT